MSQSVTVDFNANLARFTSSVDKAVADLGRFQSNADRISANVNKAFSALGVGLSVAGFLAVGKATLDAQDRLQKLSQTTKVSIEDLAGLGHAANLSGTDLESAAKAVNKLAENQGKFSEKFAALGVTAKAPLEALAQFADIFNAIDDPQKRAAVGATALGKGWQELAPLLASGGEEIRKMVRQGTELSGVTTHSANAAAALNDKITTLQLSVRGFVTKAATPAVDVLLTASEYFTALGKGAEENAPKIGAVGVVFQTIAVLGANVAYVFQGVGRELGGLAAQAAALGRMDMKGFNAISEAIKEDARRARAELDAFEKKVMNPAAATENGPRRNGGGPSSAAVSAFIDGSGSAKTASFNRSLDGFDNNLSASEIMAKLHAEDRALESQRQKYIDMIDPLQKYRVQLEEIDRLEQIGREGGGLDAQQAIEARMRVNDLMDEQIDKTEELNRVTEKTSDFAREMGMTFSSAFEDAIVGGKGASDMLRGLAQDILRISTRKLVTEPMGNSIQNALSSINFGKIFGFASGGDHLGGLRIVGENGPELEATGPSRIFNAQQTRDILSGRGSAEPQVIVQQTIQISTGVQQTVRAEVMSMMPQIQEAAVMGVIDARRRGGAARLAFRG